VSGKSLFVNALTFTRVPLILAWLGCALVQEFRGGMALGVLACVALTLSGLSDLIDGKLARRWNVVSSLGKMSDPLMDKMFYVVAFPALVWQIAHQGESDFHALLMLVFTILYLARDMWVTFMRSVGTMFGADVAALYLGKVRTALSFPCAGWTYLYLAFHRQAPASWNTSWLGSCYFFEIFMIGLTLVSLYTYTRAYWPYLKMALARK